MASIAAACPGVAFPATALLAAASAASHRPDYPAAASAGLHRRHLRSRRRIGDVHQRRRDRVALSVRLWIEVVRHCAALLNFVGFPGS